MKKEQAILLLQNAQYLQGKEVEIKKYNPRKKEYYKTMCIVKGFGAFSWNPKNPKSLIELWANLEESGTKKTIKVSLNKLYSFYPPSYFIKVIDQESLSHNNSSHLISGDEESSSVSEENN